MAGIDLGVLRQTLRFEVGELDLRDGDQQVELEGSLECFVEEGTLGELVVYTLSEDRLRDLLNLAATGSDVDGLMLDIEAAALASDDDGP